MRYHATISVRQETFEAMLTDVLGSLAAHGFENLVLIGDSGGNVSGMENVAAALNRAWADRPARVHFIPEYYTEDIYSCDFLKEELGIFQQPDECVATRNEYHDDYHYSSIMATVDPETIRAEPAAWSAGLFSINGVDLSPLELHDRERPASRRLPGRDHRPAPSAAQSPATTDAPRRSVSSVGSEPALPLPRADAPPGEFPRARSQ